MCVAGEKALQHHTLWSFKKTLFSVHEIRSVLMCAAPPPGAFKFTGFSTKSSDSKPEGKHRSGSILELIMFQCFFCFCFVSDQGHLATLACKHSRAASKIHFVARSGPVSCVCVCICVYAFFVRELKKHIFKMAPDEKLILQCT